MKEDFLFSLFLVLFLSVFLYSQTQGSILPTIKGTKVQRSKAGSGKKMHHNRLISKLKELLITFDMDDDGSIDRDELRKLLEAADRKISDSQMDLLFDLGDND